MRLLSGTISHDERNPRIDGTGTQRGFGLIESVVTLLIVSFGLLALAYMQSWGQRYGQDAAARTQATMIATELMDRIRIAGVPAAGGATAGYTDDPSDPNGVDCDPGIVSAAKRSSVCPPTPTSIAFSDLTFVQGRFPARGSWSPQR